MTLKFLCTLGILLMTVLISAQQRWLTANDKSLQTDGMFTEYPLPNPGADRPRLRSRLTGRCGSPRALAIVSAA